MTSSLPTPAGHPARDMPPTLLDLSTYLLSRIGRTARGRLAERLAERGLRLWDMAVLAALADFGPHAQRDLVERLGLDPSDLAKVADQLAAGGYVERTRDTADRRRVSVSVTDAGRALLAELDGEARAVQDEVLAPLDAQERQVLQGLLLRVHGGLSGGRVGP
ncbi:MarR family winged helix-turn-helix transcriptional regulator [Kitasatospora aureofaciens]|uniref:MarR family winged helix-turn-helix transcriptional regulator n=1 Tax=Kitasatospora aureofaciens TaxID=1894 RepID=UPI001C4524A9|nr:MarR family winged helix-turn-helix transcriptional regulator [Kitasatospora aureofaciens]MBV6699738.1 MarR family winged helix-turn-helix transcriptional regulator [Kitasatospora aureofaciens]